MRQIILGTIVLLFINACATTAVRDISEINTATVLNHSLALPAGISVVYYADFEDLNHVQRYQTYRGGYEYMFPGESMEKALALVMPGYFAEASALQLGSNAAYAFIFDSLDIDMNFSSASHRVQLSTRVVDKDGVEIFKVETKGSAGGGLLYDDNAYHNAYAKAIKDAVTLFLNSLQAGQIEAATNDRSLQHKIDTPNDVRKILGDIKPVGSGTGFYVNRSGNLVTASHVIDECMFIEAQRDEQSKQIKLIGQSKMLDLAVLAADRENPIHASIGGNNSPSLGTQVFVTGYPLSGTLMSSATLTRGNISSLSGLKGSRGEFGFSAPIQPGNSGGPIVDFEGHTVGVVNSTINQNTMLKETGTTAQNFNFGIGATLLTRFLDKFEIPYSASSAQDFKNSSGLSLDYTTQILCYR